MLLIQWAVATKVCPGFAQSMPIKRCQLCCLLVEIRILEDGQTVFWHPYLPNHRPCAVVGSQRRTYRQGQFRHLVSIQACSSFSLKAKLMKFSMVFPRLKPNLSANQKELSSPRGINCCMGGGKNTIRQKGSMFIGCSLHPMLCVCR